MPRYRNTDVHTRVWPDLQTADGSTLELDPGAEADLPHAVEDVWLAPVKAAKPKPDPIPD